MSDVDGDTWHEDDAARRRCSHTSPDGVSVLPDPTDALAFPRVPGRLVHRRRQLERLDRLAPVTVVEALPGFGKTTLAAAWAKAHQAAGRHVVWIRATSVLDDPAAFLAVVGQGLVRAGVTAGSALSDETRDWGGLLGRVERQVLLVVDDAHRLQDREVADRLLRLVHDVQPVHLVVLAEADHQFREAATRHSLETNVLRGSDLTVPAAEVGDFARAWGHDLTEEACERLHGLVGGWLLPLRLVLDATPTWSEGFATDVAQRFLTRRVLPDVADTADLGVAMRFAVPSRLDARLAAALVPGGPDREARALEMIAVLERRGLLWRSSRRDGQAEWQYPQLVRHALLDELERTDPASARAAHRAVTLVLMKERGPTRARQVLQHARAAGDWALLADLWDERGWSFAGADPHAFELAYAGLPDGAVTDHPSLALASTLGDALAATRDLGWVARVETLAQHYMHAGTEMLRRRHQITSPTLLTQVLTATMMARRSEGRLVEARHLAAEADRELGRARGTEPHRLRTSQVAWFHLQQAITHLQAGDYGSALQATTAAHQIGPSTLVGAGAAALLAAIHAIAGHDDEARRWLASHAAVDLTGRWAAPLAALPARLARAMLAMDRLDPEAAEAELREAPIGPETTGLWPLVVVVHTRYQLLFGDPTAMLFRLEGLNRVLARQLDSSEGVARRVVDRGTAELLLSLGEANRVASRLGDDADPPPWLCVPAAWFHLMTGNPAAAARLALAGTWRAGVPARDRLELLMIGAMAWREMGAMDRATETLRRAHALSCETGIHQLWLLPPEHVRRDLLEAAGLELAPEVVSALANSRRVYPEKVELVRLSERELAVLERIQHHDTAADLARTLSVSVNTVKKQLTSLYAKLGVHDRSSALLRAHRLGLIDSPDDTPAAASLAQG